jgi:hypothetical protein
MPRVMLYDLESSMHTRAILSEILSPLLLIRSITILLNTAFGHSEKVLVGTETRERGKAARSPRIIGNKIILTPIYELAN